MAREADQWVRMILEENQNKDFVRRIMDPKSYPSISLGDGVKASHLMEYGEADGMYYVYPTVVSDRGSLKQLDSNTAWEHAHKTGEVIPFKTEKEADYFSRNYKRAWADDFLRPKR